MIQVSRGSLSLAAHVLRRSFQSSKRLASSAASKLNTDRSLTPEEIYAREEKYGAHNYHPLPVALEKGEGEFEC